MDADRSELRYPTGTSSIADQDSLLEEIVMMKLRTIGDEFDRNSTEKVELLNILKSCFQQSLLDLLRAKISTVCSLTDLMEW